MNTTIQWPTARQQGIGLLIAATAYCARIPLHAWWRGRGTPAPVTILVLGTAQYNGRPSRQLAARLDHARDLAAAHPAAQIITLGGKLAGDTWTEAEVARTYLVRHGVPAERVSAVAVGNDTRGSLTALPPLAGNLVIVTDPNHAARAEAIARQVGIPAVASRVERILRLGEGWLRPSRRARHEQLRRAGTMHLHAVSQSHGEGSARTQS